MTLEQLPGGAKLSGDILAASITVGTLAQMLPSLAAAATIVWTAIRIFETDTVQRILRWAGRKLGLVRDA